MITLLLLHMLRVVLTIQKIINFLLLPINLFIPSTPQPVRKLIFHRTILKIMLMGNRKGIIGISQEQVTIRYNSTYTYPNRFFLPSAQLSITK
jgi:hypothetical protein